MTLLKMNARQKKIFHIIINIEYYFFKKYNTILVKLTRTKMEIPLPADLQPLFTKFNIISPVGDIIIAYMVG